MGGFNCSGLGCTCDIKVTVNMTEKLLHKGQNVLVVGAGVSGMAACRLALSKGCVVTLSDGRPQDAHDADDLQWLVENGVVQEFGVHLDTTFLLADLIVVSPGVPLALEPLVKARQAGVTIIGELEFGYHYFKGDIIAISGTNGKTTVTSMIAESLQKTDKVVFVGGNIGTPFCTHVMQEKQADVAVLEVSSFQLDSNLDFRPKVGLLLNISPDHLDRYTSYSAYADAKIRLFTKQTSADVAIICGTDDEIMARREQIPATIIEFDTDGFQLNTETCCLTWLRNETTSETYRLHHLQMAKPNVQNCMAAISGSRLMGAGQDAVQEMLVDFIIPNHRLTKVGCFGGIDFVNDSKATNIGAVQSALAGMNRPVILIAGGRGKGGDYGLLNAEITRIVKGMVLIGEAREEMLTAFTGMTTLVLAEDMDDAVGQAVVLAEQGDVVLLSPACASFDMFSSYGDRGQKFKDAVVRRMGAGVKHLGASCSGLLQRAV